MTYDWEKKITPALLERIAALLPPDFVLLGVAVGRAYSGGEAALIECLPRGGDPVVMADAWKDIHGDAERIYDEHVKAIFPDPGPAPEGGDT